MLRLYGGQTFSTLDTQRKLRFTDQEIAQLSKLTQTLNRELTESETLTYIQLIRKAHGKDSLYAHWKFNGQASPSLFEMIEKTCGQISHFPLLTRSETAAATQGIKINPLYPEKIENLTPAEKSKLDENRQPASFRGNSLKKSFYTYQRHYEERHAVFSMNTQSTQHLTDVIIEEIGNTQHLGKGTELQAAISGLMLSNLHIPDFEHAWEIDPIIQEKAHLSREMLLNTPVLTAMFNNIVGRPTLCGYLRTYDIAPLGYPKNIYRNYPIPLFTSGGIGSIQDQQLANPKITAGTLFVLIGSPLANKHQTLDAEMQHRCLSVIHACCALREHNPILGINHIKSIGLSSAILNLMHYCTEGSGASIHLEEIPTLGELTPTEMWCQADSASFLLAIPPHHMHVFEPIAQREACHYATIGEVTELGKLVLSDQLESEIAVDIPLASLAQSNEGAVKHLADTFALFKVEPFNLKDINLKKSLHEILMLPCVASKDFLITTTDRSITGLVARDPMVGPWQVPVADVAVTANDFKDYRGKAIALGERSPIALIDPKASIKIAIGEAITNITAANIENLSDITLSITSALAANYPVEEKGLYDAIKSATEFCTTLGLAIPIYDQIACDAPTIEKEEKLHTSIPPLSFTVSAFSAVEDVRKTLTPQLTLDDEPTDLILIDLGNKSNALGGSALSQIHNALGNQVPDTDPHTLKQFFNAIQTLNKDSLLLAYHDRSDGGLWVTLLEMAFASHCGLNIDLNSLQGNVIELLFNESLGAVIQIRQDERKSVMDYFEQLNLSNNVHIIGSINTKDHINLNHENKCIYSESRITLQKRWMETSYRLQALRDNPNCAKQAFENILDKHDMGLHETLTFDPSEDIILPYIANTPPMVAILRTTGSQGHLEMAAAFERSGFECIDVHLNDILSGNEKLVDYKGLVVCGGFSHEDIPKAGEAFANSILSDERAKDIFKHFFEEEKYFTLGVGNGCQMLTHLKSIIPNTEHWSDFTMNESEQFESRFVQIYIPESPSIFLKNMAGSSFPVPVAHKFGKLTLKKGELKKLEKNQQIALCFADHINYATERYPFNPNGSTAGITGLTSLDGRVTIMMPHPERAFRTVQNTWRNHYFQEDAPWLHMFRNARVFVG